MFKRSRMAADTYRSHRIPRVAATEAGAQAREQHGGMHLDTPTGIQPSLFPLQPQGIIPSPTKTTPLPGLSIRITHDAPSVHMTAEQWRELVAGFDFPQKCILKLVSQSLFPSPKVPPALSLHWQPITRTGAIDLLGGWDVSGADYGNIMLHFELPILGADPRQHVHSNIPIHTPNGLFSCYEIQTLDASRCKWLDGTALGEFDPVTTKFHDCSLPKYSTAGTTLPLDIIGPVARGKTLVRNYFMQTINLKHYRSALVDKLNDPDLSAELESKVHSESLTHDPLNDDLIVHGSLKVSSHNRLLKFMAGHLGAAIAGMYVPKMLTITSRPASADKPCGKRVYSAAYTGSIPLPDGSMVEALHDVLPTPWRESSATAKALMYTKLLASPEFVARIVQSSPASRADASLEHAHAAFSQANLHNSNTSENIPKTHWEFAKPPYQSYTRAFWELYTLTSKHRRERGFLPLRARSETFVLEHANVIGFRSKLVVYLGLKPHEPLATIYSAYPTHGCYPSISAADEAICRDFFIHGYGHRLALLAGNDAPTYPGLVYPPQCSTSIEAQFYIDPVPPKLNVSFGQASDLISEYYPLSLGCDTNSVRSETQDSTVTLVTLQAHSEDVALPTVEEGPTASTSSSQPVATPTGEGSAVLQMQMQMRRPTAIATRSIESRAAVQPPRQGLHSTFTVVDGAPPVLNLPSVRYSTIAGTSYQARLASRREQIAAPEDLREGTSAQQMIPSASRFSSGFSKYSRQPMSLVTSSSSASNAPQSLDSSIDRRLELVDPPTSVAGLDNVWTNLKTYLRKRQVNEPLDWALYASNRTNYDYSATIFDANHSPQALVAAIMSSLPARYTSPVPLQHLHTLNRTPLWRDLNLCQAMCVKHGLGAIEILPPSITGMGSYLSTSLPSAGSSHVHRASEKGFSDWASPPVIPASSPQDQMPLFYPLPIRSQDPATFVNVWKRIRGMLDEDNSLCELFYPPAATDILDQLSIADAWSIQPLHTLFPHLNTPADHRASVMLQVLHRGGLELLVDFLRLALPLENHIVGTLIQFDRWNSCYVDQTNNSTRAPPQVLPEVTHLTLRCSEDDAVRMGDRATSGVKSVVRMLQNNARFHKRFHFWELAHHLPNLASLELEGFALQPDGIPLQPIYPVESQLLRPFNLSQGSLFPALRCLSLFEVDFSTVVWLFGSVCNQDRSLEILILHNTFGQSINPEGSCTGSGDARFDYEVVKRRQDCASPGIVEIYCDRLPHQMAKEQKLHDFMEIILSSFVVDKPISTDESSSISNPCLPSGSGKRPNQSAPKNESDTVLPRSLSAGKRKRRPDSPPFHRNSVQSPQAAASSAFKGSLVVGNNVMREHRSLWAAICKAVGWCNPSHSQLVKHESPDPEANAPKKQKIATYYPDPEHAQVAGDIPSGSRSVAQTVEQHNSGHAISNNGRGVPPCVIVLPTPARRQIPPSLS